MITNFKIFENKNIGQLYHFTTLTSAISIIDMDRLYSLAETRDKKGVIDREKGVSLTRDKFLHKDKPKGVDFGVRFVFDGNKLSNDFEIRPYKFSRNWEESEEFLVTIGSWGTRDKLKKHQIFNLKRYIVSIDLIPKDIYTYKYQNYDDKTYNIIGVDVHEDLFDGFDSKYIYFTPTGKPKRPLVNKAKEWFESKGYDCRIIGDKFNKKAYLSDREILRKIEQ